MVGQTKIHARPAIKWGKGIQKLKKGPLTVPRPGGKGQKAQTGRAKKTHTGHRQAGERQQSEEGNEKGPGRKTQGRSGKKEWISSGGRLTKG